MPDPTTSKDGTVAVFTNRFLPYSQTFIYDEICAHERYTVDVFCKKRMNDDRFPYDRYITPGSWLRTRVYENVRYWPPYARILAEGRHDVVHAHFGFAAMHAAPVAFRNDLPLVITLWGNDVSTLLSARRYALKNWDYALCMPSILRRAARVLCVSNEMAEHTALLSGRSDNVEWFRPGIDLDRYHPQPHDAEIPQIIMVGRFTEKKGHVYAIRAFAQALSRGVDAHLTFAGDGEREPACRRLVRDLGIDDHVTFAGVLTPDEVAHALATSDVALVPSVVARNHDREGSPTVAKEASACGVPVVGTFHAGIPEIVDHGTTGLLAPERDVDALANHLLTLVRDPDLRRSMGHAARQRMMREFDLNQRVDALERVYDAVR